MSHNAPLLGGALRDIQKTAAKETSDARDSAVDILRDKQSQILTTVACMLMRENKQHLKRSAGNRASLF